MQQRNIGDRAVSAIGLGAMPMSVEGRPAAERSISAVHAALDAGVTLIDTADCYQRDAHELGHNEELIARALRDYGAGDEILVATKGGQIRPGDGTWLRNGDPEYLKKAAKESARRLGVESIGLYQFHYPDAQVPFADSIGAFRDLLDEGLIQMAGISNVSVDQIDEAREILGDRLVSVQNRFSPAFRSSKAELDHCDSLGIAFMPWSPLARLRDPRQFASAHSVFVEVADEIGVSVYQVTLAWELALARTVIPIPGASRPESIRDSAGAADLELTPQQIARLSEDSSGV